MFVVEINVVLNDSSRKQDFMPKKEVMRYVKMTYIVNRVKEFLSSVARLEFL